jgi:hypothetical protein
MTRERRSNMDDPTAELTADQTTQSASGLSSERNGPGVDRNREVEPERNRELDDPARRTREEHDATPRRYEQRTEDDPVMPSDDSSLGTKI